MDNKKETIAVDETELDAAVNDAENSSDIYTHVFKKPFVFEGETFPELTFDWDSLTAADGLAIESELAALGRAVITPEFSGEYLIRMAARACTALRADGKRRLGVDAYSMMSLADYSRIRSRARSFLLRAGS